MILVKMQVAKGVNEVARIEIDNLRHHHGEQCIGSDVERHTEKKIGATLIKLAAQLPFLVRKTGKERGTAAEPSRRSRRGSTR